MGLRVWALPIKCHDTWMYATKRHPSALYHFQTSTSSLPCRLVIKYNSVTKTPKAHKMDVSVGILKFVGTVSLGLLTVSAQANDFIPPHRPQTSPTSYHDRFKQTLTPSLHRAYPTQPPRNPFPPSLPFPPPPPQTPPLNTTCAQLVNTYTPSPLS